MRVISQHYKIDLSLKDQCGSVGFEKYKKAMLDAARYQFGMRLMKETLAPGEVLRFKEFVFDDMSAHLKELARTAPDSIEYKAARELVFYPIQCVHVFHVARIAALTSPVEVDCYTYTAETIRRVRWLNDIHWWE